MNSLSIVIPAYNAEEFLEATIRSCLQARSVAEVIVVDDGSEDGTPEICGMFDDQIRYMRVENGGVSQARNVGARMAKGEWLLFLDADDRLRPGGAEKLMATVREGVAGVAYGLVSEEQEPPRAVRVTGQNHAAGVPPHPALRSYWRCAVITPGSAVIRRDLHERVGGFVSGYEPMEDRDYWIKAGLLSPFVHVDHVVLDKTWRPVSAGKMNARRIWNGLRSRLVLPGWCEKQGVQWPTELPQEKKVVLEKAVKEAVWCGCWEILGVLLRECQQAKVRTFWTMRAGLEFALRGGGRRWPTPKWVVEIGGRNV